MNSMNNELPQVQKVGFFTKIREFFKSLINKKNNKVNQESIENESLLDKKINNTFVDDLKNGTEEHIEKYNLYNLAMKNPDIIDKWSFSKLRELDKICNEKISQINNKV